jgi:hypothetical protein
MSRKFIEETIDRINKLMEGNVSAKTYSDLSYGDNAESMELVSRVSDIADAAEKCRSERLSEDQRQFYAFAENLKSADVDLFKKFFAWFRGLSKKGHE